jgi:hypothetical protein
VLRKTTDMAVYLGFGVYIVMYLFCSLQNESAAINLSFASSFILASLYMSATKRSSDGLARISTDKSRSTATALRFVV